MPIENEKKYVLRDFDAAYQDLLKGVPYTPGYWGRLEFVEQGYLPGDARIRRVWVGGDPGLSAVFTYKIATPDGLVEIEKLIDMDDFKRLWPLTRDRLHKRRFHVWECQGEVSWDIDFFLDSEDRFYFAMAECEMPGGMVEPPEILPPLQPHIEYLVPLDRQLEFTNVRLADPQYARSLKW